VPVCALGQARLLQDLGQVVTPAERHEVDAAAQGLEAVDQFDRDLDAGGNHVAALLPPLPRGLVRGAGGRHPLDQLIGDSDPATLAFMYLAIRRT